MIFKDKGEYILREGDDEVGTYFIWEGEVSWLLIISVTLHVF